ncbi:hypothetical protein HPB50_007618 [Hyalomma asiaticum]|uniref:Uncharacterized protein n=1 Tax=Hyalomma asiaticum TaxID=266040 RepID=A0ACB7SCY1_HYAAI|nr:hypothetical protein HPB50_007618 [Hyalomma asiaticum]
MSSIYDDQFTRIQLRRQASTEDITNYVYDMLRLLNNCGITRQSPAVCQYVIDGLLDSTRAAILFAQSAEISPQTFAQKAAELEQCTQCRLIFGHAAAQTLQAHLSMTVLRTSWTPRGGVPPVTAVLDAIPSLPYS